MAKGSNRRVALGLLLLPLFYAVFLRGDVASSPIWKLQLSYRHNNLSLKSSDSSTTDNRELIDFLLRRLVREGPATWKARRDLGKKGVSCISDQESDICITTSPVRIATGSPITVHLTAGQFDGDALVVRPYPRKTDAMAMSRTSPVTLVAGGRNPPPCDVTHPFPAVVFSIGGFAGNFFHDINDVIIPLFITSGYLRSRVRLVVADFEPWWNRKYHRVLRRLSNSDVIVASDPKVHCFPAAVVGLKYHGNLACKSTDAPGGVSIIDFRRFLLGALSLRSEPVGATDNPVVLVLVSRSRSRVLLNEGAVVELAEQVGFRVVVTTPENMSNVNEFSALVNDCGVLMGVHGAGLTNMVFLAPRAVVLQVVPWGLEWAAAAYYGRPAVQMGLQYVEYHIEVEESSLYDQYPKDHPVLTDPWSINLKGYNVSRPVYTDGQNLTLHLSRFRDTLLQARQLLARPSRR